MRVSVLDRILCRTRLTHRASRARGTEGAALITVLYVIFAVGLMLFAFAFFNQSEAVFAGLNRNSTVALDLAEAGVQEAVNRLGMSGVIPGSTCFTNSLAGGGSCRGGAPVTDAVAYQAPFSSNTAVFPILSIATFGGAQRAVRILEMAAFKPGFGTTIVGPQVIFKGDSSPITGDTYAQTSQQFQTYAKSPQPAQGASATNLISPQVLAGTGISTQGSGPGPFSYECAAGAMSTEVPPTPCARAVDGSNNTVPVNWHPMTPIGMNAADFTTVYNDCAAGGCLGGTVTIAAATQGGTTVVYSPVSYTPSYWTPQTTGKVFLAYSTGQFCVNSSAGTVSAPSGGACTSGTLYGASGTSMRYLDWGLVSDDLSRTQAKTFFQAPSCQTCSNGNQNGIRYIPLLPPLWGPSPLPAFAEIACGNNISPGFSAFYNATSDGLTCPNPPTQPGSLTFTGTESNPEYLVIDNGPPGGTQVSISGNGSAPNGCSDTFASANWGVIIATGDINLQGLDFSGLIYTPGSVFGHGNPVIRGGIFSATPPSTQVQQVEDWGTMKFCGGASTSVPLSPEFFNFSTVSWQDRPLNQK
jgi:hypothetical protein